MINEFDFISEYSNSVLFFLLENRVSVDLVVKQWGAELSTHQIHVFLFLFCAQFTSRFKHVFAELWILLRKVRELAQNSLDEVFSHHAASVRVDDLNVVRQSLSTPIHSDTFTLLVDLGKERTRNRLLTLFRLRSSSSGHRETNNCPEFLFLLSFLSLRFRVGLLNGRFSVGLGLTTASYSCFCWFFFLFLFNLCVRFWLGRFGDRQKLDFIVTAIILLAYEFAWDSAAKQKHKGLNKE